MTSERRVPGELPGADTRHRAEREAAEFTFSDLLAALWLSKIQLALCIVAFGIAALLAQRQLPLRFEAEAKLIADPSYAALSDVGQDETVTVSDPAVTRTIVETIDSATVIDRALSALSQDLLVRWLEMSDISVAPDGEGRPDIAGLLASAPDRQEIIERIGDDLKSGNGGQSYIIDVSYTAPDPEIAAAMVNAVVGAYFDFRGEERGRIFGQMVSIIDERLQGLQTELRAAEGRAQEMRERVRLLERQSEAMTGTMQDQAITQNAQAFAEQREAEREAEAIAAVYEYFLLQQRELQNRLGLPDVEVRSLVPATPPLEPSGPGGTFFLALGLMLGAAVGAAWAVLRYKRSRPAA